MEETVSAAEANRKFSSLLKGVREGRSYVVTSHGKPVARIIPADDETKRREEARAALYERLKNQPATNIGPWTREELYEDDE